MVLGRDFENLHADESDVTICELERRTKIYGQ